MIDLKNWVHGSETRLEWPIELKDFEFMIEH